MNVNAMTSCATSPSQWRIPGAKPADDTSRKVIETAREVINTTFFGTLMKQTRGTFDTDSPLSGGRTGQIFSRQLDMQLISGLAANDRMGIADAIVNEWPIVKQLTNGDTGHAA